MNSFTFNLDNGFLEGIVRGFKAGILKGPDYINLTQCENLDGNVYLHVCGLKVIKNKKTMV